MSQNGATILLVEDSEDDVFIMKLALKQARLSHPLQVVTDGQMALDYLAGTGRYSDRAQFPLPSVVFLDLKLPYVHGFEVLSWISKQETLKSIVVIILTGSNQETDQQRASVLGAQSYWVKPPTANMLLGLFKPSKNHSVSNPGTSPLGAAAHGQRPDRTGGA